MSRSGFRKLLVAAAMLLMSGPVGCSSILHSSFFQITKENAEPRPAPAEEQHKQPEKTVAADMVVADSSAVAAEPAAVWGAEPPADSSDDAGVDRLVTLGHIWSLVANFHPWIESRGIPWDSALASSVLKARSAVEPGEYQAVLRGFLAVTGDPATRLVVGGDEGVVSAGGSRGVMERLETADSVLVLQLPADAFAGLGGGMGSAAGSIADGDANAGAMGAGRVPDAIVQGIGQYRRVVIDIRSTSAVSERDARAFMRAVDAATIASQLTTEPIAAPAERRRAIGAMYVRELPMQIAVGGAPSAWLSTAAVPIAAAAPQLMEPVFIRDWLRRRKELPPVPVSRRIVIVANSNSVWPASLLALRAAGKVSLYVEGMTGDHLTASHSVVDVGASLALRLRTGETYDATHPLFAADSVFDVSVLPDTTAPAVAAALAAVRGEAVLQASQPPVAVRVQLPAYFDTAAYPVMGARVLGVMRLWSAMRSLHAHRDLYDEDLDEQFRAAIRLAESAKSDTGYARALLRIASVADDRQLQVRGSSVEKLLGLYAVPLRVKWVGQRAIVTAVAGVEGGAGGIVAGDEIVSVYGFPVAAWMNEMRWSLSSPNEWTRAGALMEYMRRGNAGAVHMRVRDAKGSERNIELPRSLAYNDFRSFTERAKTAVMKVGEDIVVVDATLGNQDDDTLSTADKWYPGRLPESKALIVDLRGNVSAAGAAFVRRVISLPMTPFARSIRRGASEPCNAVSLRMVQFVCGDERRSDPVAVNAADYVSGGITPTPFTLVLVDETTNIRGEWLVLELANAGVRLAGSSTTGAFARTSELRLPGGLSVDVPLEEIRTIDGRQLHRVGLTPQLELYRTVQGERAGTDEVVDKAVQQLRTELNPPPVRRRR